MVPLTKARVKMPSIPSALERRVDIDHGARPPRARHPLAIVDGIVRPELIAKRMVEADALAMHQDQGVIPLPDILWHLDIAGVTPLITGGHAIGAWAGRPRAADHTSLVIPAAKREHCETALRAAYPHFTVTYSNGDKDVTWFSDMAEPKRPLDRIEIIQGRMPVHRIALATCITVPAFGRFIRIPSAEALVLAKVVSAVSSHSPYTARMQDRADLAKLIGACTWLREDAILIMARSVSSDLEHVVREVFHELRTATPNL